jgi:hypothetical protein
MTLEGYTRLSRAAEQGVIVGRFDHTLVGLVLSMRTYFIYALTYNWIAKRRDCNLVSSTTKRTQLYSTAITHITARILTKPHCLVMIIGGFEHRQISSTSKSTARSLPRTGWVHAVAPSVRNKKDHKSQ